MMTREQSDFMTQTGPGTPMGNLFRRYWWPALKSEELPEPGCAPVRVKLLCETLLAYRDTSGNYALIDEFCAHRGVSLWFGRAEETGIRCPYHGWKYDNNGQCVEIPSEAADSGYAKRIKLAAYPLVDLGGILWTYMGPPELQPPLPEFEFTKMPPKQRYASKRWQQTNYLQALEGGLDSSHVTWLHRGALDRDPLFAGSKGNAYTMGTAFVADVVESEGGMLFGARRDAENGNHYWRIAQWVMPTFTAIAPRADHPIHGHFWVPIDDENCWTWSYDYHPVREFTDAELKAMEDGHSVHAKMIPGTFMPALNKENNYMMNRADQRAGISAMGIEGIGTQDTAIQESMGPLQDRTRENLASSDRGIILARKRLRNAALALEQGVEPPGVNPASHQVRSAALVLPPGVRFEEAAKDALKVKPGERHATV